MFNQLLKISLITISSCLLLSSVYGAALNDRYADPFLLEQFAKASSLIASNQYKEAIPELERVLEKNKQNSDIQFFGFFRLGLCYQKSSSYQEAVYAWIYNVQNARAEDSVENQIASVALFQSGMCYRSMKQSDKALKYFGQVINKYPESIDIPFAITRMVDCYRDNKDIDGAEKEIKTLIDKYPEAKIKYYGLSSLSIIYSRDKKDYPGALAIHERIVQELDIAKYPDLKYIKVSSEKIIPQLKGLINKLDIKK
jgi:tetratricopeptide (TPR) repeat protein